MNGFSRIITISVLLVPLTWAGGGEDYSREDEFSKFNNPNLSLQKSFNTSTLKSLVAEISELDLRNAHRQPHWQKDKIYSNELNQLLAENNRPALELPSVSDGDLFLDAYSWTHCANGIAKSAAYEFAKLTVQQPELSDATVQSILLMRDNIAQRCSTGDESKLTFSAYPAIPVQWQTYLTGIDFYYQDRHVEAATYFEQSYQGNSKLVQDLSSYMVARSYLIAAQDGWRSWESKDKLNRAQLDTSALWFQRHIDDDGLYSTSAFGQMGRVDYFRDDQARYLENVNSRFATALATGTELELSKLIVEYVITGGSPEFAQLLLAQPDLNARRESSGFVRMATFIRAQQAYNEDDYDRATALFFEAEFNAGFAYLVEIAKITNDVDLERKAIKRFVDGNTKDLYLAEVDYRSSDLGAFLNSDNPVLVENSAQAMCSIDELETAIRNNLNGPNIQAAMGVLYTALLQDKQFAQVYSLFNEPEFQLGEFELIRTALAQIEAGESLGKAYMNVGYFMETKVHPTYRNSLNLYLNKPYADVFCKTRQVNSDTGAEYFYQLAIEQFPKDENSTDEAKTLSFMVNCGHGGSRGCWGDRPERAEPSRKLYERLHRKYKGSRWADETPYYY